MRSLALVGLMAVLSACQTGAALSRCSGSAFGLNSAHWRPSAEDIRACSQAVAAR